MDRWSKPEATGTSVEWLHQRMRVKRYPSVRRRGEGRTPTSPTFTKRVLNKHFLPPFRRKCLDEITDTEIGKIIEGMSHTPSAANHAFTAVRTFFRWAVKPPRRYIPYSPMTACRLRLRRSSASAFLPTEN